MTRVRSGQIPPPPPPAAAPERAESPDGVPIENLPNRLKARVGWAERTYGNGDGVMNQPELDSYRTAREHDPVDVRVASELQGRMDVRHTRTENLPSARELATGLMLIGGTATAEDVAAVVTAAARLPAELLERIRVAGLRVRVCRESVTDHLPALRHTQPRGWPPGMTWDSVPAMFDSNTGEIIIATLTGPQGHRVVPNQGAGHGAIDVVFHEIGHGLDDREVLGVGSRSETFGDAYTSDRPAMQRNGELYMLQEGSAGREEAFAEVSARYFFRDPSLATNYPNLEHFFSDVCQQVGIPR